VLAELELDGVPVLPVFNKMDAVADPVDMVRRVRELHPDAIFATTTRTDGLEPLKGVLRLREQASRPAVRVRLPASAGAELAGLYRRGEVLAREDRDGTVEVDVRLPPPEVARLRAAGVDVRTPGGIGP